MGEPLRSMTGFGAAEGQLSARLRAGVRMTSVNGRVLEVAVRVQPRLDLVELEAGMRAVIGERVARGRVQLAVVLQRTGSDPGPVTLRWDLAERLVAELAALPAGIRLAPLSLGDLIAVPGFVEGGGELQLDETESGALLELVAAARDALLATREAEAAALRPSLDADLASLAGFAAWLAEVNASVKDALLVRLRQRLAELLGGVTLPDERLLVEAAIAADRADVSEEAERLRAHLGHVRGLLDTGGPVGKRLDFLSQELLREINTAGSKCREAGVGERVVEAKSAVERLREQFANLE